MIVESRDLQVGDLVDLQDDKYADPLGYNMILEFELQEVCEVEIDGDDCIAVAFEGFDTVGFPPDHKLVIRR